MDAIGKNRRKWTATAGPTLLLFGLVAALTLVPAVREAQVRLSDTLFQFAPAPARRSSVVIVTIDEESLRQYGRWPWARTRLAQLVTNLTHAGASAVGLDVLLSEPQSREDDLALSAAFRIQGKSVIVDKIGSLPQGPHWVEPIPEFTASVAAVGHTHAVLDADGICRRFQPAELSLDGERLAFAIELAKQVDPQAASSFIRANRIPLADHAVLNIVHPSLLRIPFRRDGFDVIPAADVLAGKSLEHIGGRPVLVGFGANDIGDRVATPFATEVPVPGVEIHAQILDGILTARTVREMPIWASALLVLACCFVTVQAFRWRHGITAVILFFCMIAGIYLVALLGFARTSYLLPVGAMMITVLAGPVLVFAMDIMTVERSVARQLAGLRSWLRPRGQVDAVPSSGNNLSRRLDLLHNLQSQLGSRYELHEALLEATQDLIAIFDTENDLLLKNNAFAAACRIGPAQWFSLSDFRAQLIDNPDAAPVTDGSTEEREVFLGTELFLMRTAPLPATTLSPEGGTIVTLSSLRNRVERDRARSEALGFITHELRTPLASIQGFAELIMRDPVISVAEGAPETIYRESQRLLALISSYLDVLRLDAGAKPIASHVIDMEGLVSQVFNILEPMAGAAGMQLVSDIPTPITFEGDEPLISGALLNLVSNAIKYGKPGSEIRVLCAHHATEIMLRVENEGPAIPQEEIPRLFDPYYRASRSPDRSGWGLGLAFVKRIAEKHGGWVSAESSASSNTFEIHLPNPPGSLQPVGEKHENDPAP